MTSLFIDTSTNRLIIGIYKDKKQIYLENEESNNDLSSKVLPHLKKSLNNLNLTINDIDDIYIVNGPGSFTGIRVGVTIAKTLGCAINKPIYPVSELQLIATTGTSKYIVPLIDARRGYVYAGVYDNNLKSIIPDQYIKLENLYELLDKYDKKDVTFISYDGIESATEPNINIEKLLLNGKFESVLAHHLNPNYLKKTEAEEKLNDKKNNWRR